MEQNLYECCKIILQLLKKLFEEGKITKEEYNRHIELKCKYTEDFDGK